MKIPFTLITLIIVVFASCQNTKEDHHNDAKFPKRAGAVNDFGDIYSAKEEKVLDSLSMEFEDQFDVELTIISLDSTMTTLEGFNSYTLRLANVWGVNKKEDKKVLIAISAPLQRVRINKGLAIQKELSGTHITEIMDVFMFPEFRKGDYFEGTRLGIEQLMKKLNK
ncbi:MAG: TPM domain-containing protein [Pyrinomonadaceae bacterium]|nr:TPM domain-containing protein [Sphingobacteriaceae bacterium]